MVVIEDLGIMEIDVYDIETENTHMFFANDILVHNSIYLNLDPVVKMVGITETQKIVEMLDKFCEEKLQKIIDGACEGLIKYLNAYKNHLSMKREAIAETAIWVAKKRYIMNIWDLEGVRFSEPKLKMVGIEAVRSSTPKSCRNAIEKTLKIIMNKDEVSTQEYIESFRQNFKTLPFEDVAFPRGVNNMDKYTDRANIFAKGTPIAVRGALLYNDRIKKLKLEKYLEDIKEGSKIKFAYLKMPNPLRQNVISVPETLPNEFGLDNYIDRTTQFEKAYLNPITKILDVIGWSAEPKTTLYSLFN